MRSIAEIIAEMNELNVTPSTLQREILSLENEIHEYIMKEELVCRNYQKENLMSGNL